MLEELPLVLLEEPVGDVVVVVPVLVEDDATVVELEVDFPGIVEAPTTPNTPRAPMAARATPAVSWLTRWSARSRAVILLRTVSVSGMPTWFAPALKHSWETAWRLL